MNPAAATTLGCTQKLLQKLINALNAKDPAFGRALNFLQDRSDELRGLFLDHFGCLFPRLRRTATRTLGERGFDFLDRFSLGHVLHRRNLAREAIERGFIKLPLAIGLFGLRLRTEEIAHHFGDRTMSPELILASYSCARRDHMVRLTHGL